MPAVNKSEIRRVLEAAVGEDFHVGAVSGVADAMETGLEGFGRRYRLKLFWAGSGWPGEVRALGKRLGDRGRSRAVVVARRLSPGALSWLDGRAANYADATGRARIVTPDGLVLVRGPARPEAGKAARADRFAWSSGRADIAEILLAERRVPPVRELAELTDLDIAFVSRTLAGFDARGWTEKHGPARGRRAGRRLRDLGALLESWSEHVAAAPRETIRAHLLTEDPLGDLERKLAPALARFAAFAVSGWAGAQLVAPFVTTVSTVHLYIEQLRFGEPLRAFMRARRLREVTEGERLIFWPARPPALSSVRETTHGVPVAHSARLYADLLALGERGRATADHVRAEFLGAD